MTIYNLPNDSIVEVYDIFNPLPSFMKRADTLFIDSPYNQSLLSNFVNRSEVELSNKNNRSFHSFTIRLFECIDEISPDTLFVEMGKEYLSWYLEECKKRFKHVTFYNSTYYHKNQNKCYVIHATNKKPKRYPGLEDMDEEDIIKWVCQNHQYECIGDLCMGTGLIGKHAFLSGRTFVGTELNPKRLAVLVDFIAKNSGMIIINKEQNPATSDTAPGNKA